MSEYLDFRNIDDEKAPVIVQQLAATENSHVTRLHLYPSEHLTVSGAQVIAHGLQQSHNIETLHIWYDDDVEPNGNVLRPLFVVAFQHIHELCLNFDLNNSAANALSEILLSLDDNDGDGENHSLQSLELRIRANMTTVEEAQQLAIGLRHAKLKCLDLHVYRLENVEIMSMVILAALESVRELSLFGNYLIDDAAIIIGDAMVGNSTLQSISFKVDHEMSVDAAVRLANGISHSNIVDLSLYNYGRFGELPADVADAFYEGVARLPTIRKLKLGHRFHATPGLAQCLTRLHTFEMCHPFAVEEVPTLMTGLRNAPDLTSLKLHKCFPLAFEEQPNDGNDDINNESSSPDLRRIRATTAQQLMLAVANCPSLDELTLYHCCDIGFAGLAMIGMHLPNITKLSELCLYNIRDEYSTDDKRESVKQAYQRACQALVDGVKANWRLRVLKLPRGIPSKITDEINFYLDLNKSGRYLLHETDNEKVPTGLWCHVLAKCRNKADFLYYYLREQPTLAASGMCHEELNCKSRGSKESVGTKRRREE